MTFLYCKNAVSVVCTAGLSISSYIFIWMYPLLLLYLGFFSADMWVIVLIAECCRYWWELYLFLTLNHTIHTFAFLSILLPLLVRNLKEMLCCNLYLALLLLNIKHQICIYDNTKSMLDVFIYIFYFLMEILR